MAEIDYIPLLHKRDSVFVKIGLARAFLASYHSEFAELTYLDHLYWWNDFYEDYPKKRGPKDFVGEFRELAKSVTQHGFLADYPGIGRNSEGQMVSGSHRMALHLALTQLGMSQSSPVVTEIDFPLQDYSLHAFHKAGLHPAAHRQAVLEKINFFRENHVPIVVIWPKAQPHREEILATLRGRWPHLATVYDVTLRSQALHNFISLVYRDEDWSDTSRGISGKFLDVAGSTDSTPVSIVVLEPGTGDSLRDLKEEIRSLWQGKFQGIHTTDSWEESLRVFSTLSSAKSSALLGLIEPKVFMSAQKELPQFCGEADQNPLGPIGYAVSGSQWLQLFGIRKRNDFDAVSLDAAGFPEYVSNHNGYVEDFGFSAQQLLTEPQNHIWFMGKKHVSPWVYSRIIALRGEQKDIVSARPLAEKMGQLDEHTIAVKYACSVFDPSAEDIDEAKVGPLGASRVAREIESSETALGSKTASSQLSTLRHCGLTIRWRLGSFLRRLPLFVPLSWRRRVGRVLRAVVAIIRKPQ